MSILAIETSTKNCSVALFDGANLLAFRDEVDENYAHAERLNVIIGELLEAAQLSFEDLSAIAVGKGPGSYTGLRIGVSSAKGFAYQRSIPLLSFDSLEPLVIEALSQFPKADVVLPMIDARRMEVFTQVYEGGKAKGRIEAIVLDEAYFDKWKNEQVVVIGDGAEKCLPLLVGKEHIHVVPSYPKAKYMATAMQEKLTNGNVEDTAYFEPFYLKEFIAGKPKKALI